MSTTVAPLFGIPGYLANQALGFFSSSKETSRWAETPARSLPMLPFVGLEKEDTRGVENAFELFLRHHDVARLVAQRSRELQGLAWLPFPTPAKFTARDLVHAFKVYVQQLSEAESRISPMLRLWLYGGGVFKGVDKQGAIHTSAVVTLGDDEVGAWEARINHGVFNHKGSVMHTLPGEFILEHGHGRGHPLASSGLQATQYAMTIGPTVSGRTTEYVLVYGVSVDTDGHPHLFETDWDLPEVRMGLVQPNREKINFRINPSTPGRRSAAESRDFSTHHILLSLWRRPPPVANTPVRLFTPSPSLIQRQQETIVVASDLVDKFAEAARANTLQQMETGAYLFGPPDGGTIATVVIPQQRVTHSTWQQTEAGVAEVLEYAERSGLEQRAWIHIHPKPYSLFLSSTDLRTQFGIEETSRLPSFALVLSYSTDRERHALYRLSALGKEVIGRRERERDTDDEFDSTANKDLYEEVKNVTLDTTVSTTVVDFRK